MAGIHRQWYILSTGDVTVSASTTGTKSIRIPDDADFELAQILVPKATSFLFKFQLKFVAQDKYLSNNPVPYLAVAGKGGTEDKKEPYDVPPEGRVLFPSGTDILIELTDYSASPNTIDFVLGGFKVRPV